MQLSKLFYRAPSHLQELHFDHDTKPILTSSMTRVNNPEVIFYLYRLVMWMACRVMVLWCDSSRRSKENHVSH